ncbi:hypothetical protein [Desulfovibrio litoralis]|nr:hypothetical protein [Desulfovibrio litoralis]
MPYVASASSEKTTPLNAFHGVWNFSTEESKKNLQTSNSPNAAEFIKNIDNAKPEDTKFTFRIDIANKTLTIGHPDKLVTPFQVIPFSIKKHTGNNLSIELNTKTRNVINFVLLSSSPFFLLQSDILEDEVHVPVVLTKEQPLARQSDKINQQDLKRLEGTWGATKQEEKNNWRVKVELKNYEDSDGVIQISIPWDSDGYGKILTSKTTVPFRLLSCDEKNAVLHIFPAAPLVFDNKNGSIRTFDLEEFDMKVRFLDKKQIEVDIPGFAKAFPLKKF